MDYQMFVVQPREGSSTKFICGAFGREEAKRRARVWLGLSNPDTYVVTPITNPGDKFKIDTATIRKAAA